jgi:hypothetical protein
MGKNPVFILLKIEGSAPENFSENDVESGLPDALNIITVREIGQQLCRAINVWKMHTPVPCPEPSILRLPAMSAPCRALDARIFGKMTGLKPRITNISEPDTDDSSDDRDQFHFRSLPSKIKLRPVREKPRPGVSREVNQASFRTMRTLRITNAIRDSREEAQRYNCDIVMMILPPQDFDEAARQLVPPAVARALKGAAAGPVAGCTIDDRLTKLFFPAAGRHALPQEVHGTSLPRRIGEPRPADIRDCEPGDLSNIARPSGCPLKREVA